MKQLFYYSEQFKENYIEICLSGFNSNKGAFGHGLVGESPKPCYFLGAKNE